MIISPAAPRTSTVAAVSYRGNSILCTFKEHNDAFRGVVKGLRLSWSEKHFAWRRILDVEINGTPLERAAELCSGLLNAGFQVNVTDDVTQAVQGAAWKPEHRRWIIAGNDEFHLRWWKESDENLYSRAKMLPEAHYDPETKSVVVPALYALEVEGFAVEHDFYFTQSAKALLEKSQADYRCMLLPAIPFPAAPTQPKRRKERYCDPARFSDLPIHHLETTTALLPHQIPAVDKLLPMRVGAFFMDQGTGKTRCAIELAARRQARISKVIWFCPVSLKLTIAAEIEKHSKGEAIYIFDDETAPDNIPPAFWYVAGIESMSSSDRIILAVNTLVDGDTFVIVDESSYIKGHASKRSMRIAELCKRSRYRLLLTGTPISQGVEDLYAQMRFLSPGILGYSSFYSFAHNHLEYSEKYPGLIVRAHNTEHLAAKIAPYTYQVTKAECMTLPEKLYDQVYCALTPEQSEAYENTKYNLLMSVESEKVDSYVIFRLFTALQQIISGFYNDSGTLCTYPHNRIKTLSTVIAGIPEGEKVIIWCKFLRSLDQIAELLPGSALYYGKLNEQKRQAEIERFRSDARFLIATQATGGHGLTLNEARYVVFYENEFKYSHRIQAEDRCHRIGQDHPVTYIDVVSTSGIDRRIQQALARKEDVVKAFRCEVNKVKEERSLLGTL